jgi:hypothetical protein
MPFLTYSIGVDTPSASIHAPKLHEEVAAAGPFDTDFVGIEITGTSILVHFAALPSGADTVAVDAVITAHDHSLSQAKESKIAAIDKRTSELIADGFVYANKSFSLTLSSQSKMIAAHQIKDHPAFVYPVRWNTKDDDDAVDIPDSADMSNFYLTAIGAIRAHLDSGTDLKDSVRSAATTAEVDAVIDDR